VSLGAKISNVHGWVIRLKAAVGKDIVSLDTFPAAENWRNGAYHLFFRRRFRPALTLATSTSPAAQFGF
jgi:hypothetical protein